MIGEDLVIGSSINIMRRSIKSSEGEGYGEDKQHVPYHRIA